MATNNELVNFLGDLLNSFDKSAEAETGSTQSAQTGERASENTSDVKKNVPGVSVDASKDNSNSPSGSGQNTPTNKDGLGNGAAETGKGVPTPESNREDPGTSHPAKVGGEKFASEINDLLAAIAVLSKQAADSAGAVADKPASPVTAPADGTKSKETKDKPAVMDEANVTVKKAELDELRAAQAELHRVIGYATGQQVTNALSKQAGTQSTEITDDMILEKIASELLERVAPAADAAATDVISFVLGTQKAAEDVSSVLAAGADPAAAAVTPDAMAGAGAGAAPGAGGGGDQQAAIEMLSQLPPEVLQQLVEALMSGGATPEDVDSASAAVDQASASEASADSASSESPAEEKREEKPAEAEKSAAVQKMSASVLNFINKVKLAKQANINANKPKQPVAKPAVAKAPVKKQ